MKHLKPLLVFLLVIILGLAYSKSALAVSFSELTFDTSIRTNQLNWNIASDLTGQATPNILSELSWTNVMAQVFDCHAKLDIDDRMSLTGFLSLGLIYQGANQDSDYLDNNRTGEFSQSNNNASNGETFDTSIALSYQFVRTERWNLSGSFGFSSYNQFLVITDGDQTISVPPNQTMPLGPFPGLDSSYSAFWYGPWLGLNVDFYISKHFWLDCDLEGHYADYSGEGYWNLRPMSFSHTAEGLGSILSFGVNYQFSDYWAAGLSLESSYWSTGAGVDTTYFTDGSYTSTRLNQVNWSYFEVTLKLTRLFH